MLLLVITHGYAQRIPTSFEPTHCFLQDSAALRGRKIQWGYLTVPERRDIPNNRSLKLAVAVLKCTAAAPAGDPVVYLDGGPGGSAIDKLSFWMRHPLLAKRDIILVDLRGTGHSTPGFCPALGDTMVKLLSRDLTEEMYISEYTKAAEACKQDLLKRGIDLRAYNSTESAADIAELMPLLGFRTWNILSASYGTRVALILMRDHPEGIRSVVLDSPVPFRVDYFDRNTSNFSEALNRICRKCEADPACKQAFPDMRRSVDELIQDYEKHPLTLSVPDTRFANGRFVVNGQDVMLLMQQALYDTRVMPLLPLLIDQLRKRNGPLIVNFLQLFSSQTSGIDYGTYYCVMCNETMPVNSLAGFDRDAAASPRMLGGLVNYRAEYFVCQSWNIGGVDPPGHDTLSTQIPSLILSGEMDPITPPGNGRLLQPGLNHSFLMELPMGGHALSFEDNLLSPIAGFIDNPQKKPVFDAGKTSPPFVTDIRSNAGVFQIVSVLLENPQIKDMALILFIVIAFTQAVLFWPVRGVVRKIKKKPGWRSDIERNLAGLGYLTALMGLLFFIAFAVMIVRLASVNPYELVIGFPRSYLPVMVIPYIMLGVLVLYAGLIFTAIKRRSWSAASKFQTILVVLGCAAFLYFVGFWGLFPL